jgi:hypothetical protein
VQTTKGQTFFINPLFNSLYETNQSPVTDLDYDAIDINICTLNHNSIECKSFNNAFCLPITVKKVYPLDNVGFFEFNKLTCNPQKIVNKEHYMVYTNPHFLGIFESGPSFARLGEEGYNKVRQWIGRINGSSTSNTEQSTDSKGVYSKDSDQATVGGCGAGVEADYKQSWGTIEGHSVTHIETTLYEADHQDSGDRFAVSMSQIPISYNVMESQLVNPLPGISLSETSNIYISTTVHPEEIITWDEQQYNYIKSLNPSLLDVPELIKNQTDVEMAADSDNPNTFNKIQTQKESGGTVGGCHRTSTASNGEREE